MGGLCQPFRARRFRMTQPLVEITRRETFSAAHRLHDPRLSDEENQRLYGVCSSDHGHNYAVEVTVRGAVPGSGMVLDLNRLMQILREEIISQVDHKHLNRDVSFLRGIIPTAENVAVAFWERIEEPLSGFESCSLHRVRVYESRENFVDYHGRSA
jgi:6-pyruvoyltetrahydropterin/6-carboxytetrahydropterin synthase